ncbi:MAG: hypothetical protein ACYC3I_08735 [Gemmataceae bacterium]
MKHFWQNGTVNRLKMMRFWSAVKLDRRGEERTVESELDVKAIKKGICANTPAAGSQWRKVWHDGCFTNCERLVASPNLSVRNDFSHIHTSHLWHGDWLVCESQPNPVPTPLYNLLTISSQEEKHARCDFFNAAPSE